MTRDTFNTKIRHLRWLQKYTKIFQRIFGGYAELSSIIRVLGCFPSLMQAWIRTIIPSLFVCFAANRHQRLIMFFELFKVLRSLSVLRTLGFASLCLHNSTNPLRVLSKTQPRLDDEYTCGRLNRVLTQIQRQMQERYRVARVKTDTLDRRERGSKKGSENIVNSTRGRYISLYGSNDLPHFAMLIRLYDV